MRTNGLRYPRWGGRRDAVRLGKCWGVEKGLESRQTPQRRVHALLGSLPADQNLCLKRQHRKLDWILHATLLFTKTQKLYANQNTCWEKWILQNKTTNEPEQKFWKTWHNQKMTMPTKPRKFYKLNLPELLQKKDKPILRTYKTNLEHCEKRTTQPTKIAADQNAN